MILKQIVGGKKSIYIGFNQDTGKLKQFGYYHPAFSLEKIYSHPDSGVAFSEITIKEIPEAIETCLKAHSVFYNSFLIGWDIVVTPEGPLILEANDARE